MHLLTSTRQHKLILLRAIEAMLCAAAEKHDKPASAIRHHDALLKQTKSKPSHAAWVTLWCLTFHPMRHSLEDL
jgi:hypothetical protein